MKKTTQKEVRATHAHVISVPYCALQHLLRCRTPYAHTERREGWGADIYSVGNCAIATGYAPFGDVKPSHEIMQGYENKAKAICNDNCNYAEKEHRLISLLLNFCCEVCPDDN